MSHPVHPSLSRAFLSGALCASSLCGAASAQISPEARHIVPGLNPIAAIDYDGDGQAELIGPTGIDSELAAYTIDSAGELVFEKRLARLDRPLDSPQMADVDGDGLNDLLGISRGDLQDEIVVFYDRGNPQFEDAVRLRVIEKWLEVAVTDFDLDGDQDLVTFPASRQLDDESQPAGSLRYIPNLGGGTFGPSQDAQASPELLQSAAPISLDQDGDQDFVAFRGASATLIILRNTGASLQAEALPASASGYLDLDVGDVNGDGLPDVIAFRRDVTFGPASVDLFLGLPSGSLGSPTTLIAADASLAADVQLLDADGDDHLDVAVTTKGTSQTVHRIMTLRGDGVGGFASPLFSDNGLGRATARCLVGDVNGDGKDDLLNSSLVSESSSSTSTRTEELIRFGQAAGGLLAFDGTREIGIGAAIGLNVFGDLDGDGVIDVLAESAEGNVWIRGSEDASAFENPRPLPFSGTVLEVADLDSDGVDEILVLDPLSSVVSVLDSIGGGSFAPLAPLMSPATIASAEHTALDFDNDGDLDIMLQVTLPAALSWMENLGDLSFAAPVELLQAESFGSGESPFHLGDFNGDGLVDVLVESFSIQLFRVIQSWHEGLGNGVLGTAQFIGRAGNLRRTEDINLDGFEDLLWQQTSGFPVLWAPGSSAGILPTDGELLVTVGVNERLLGLLDFDGDGLEDLVTRQTTGSVYGYRRLTVAMPTFASTSEVLADTAVTFPFGGLGSAVVPSLVDFGGDGDVDIYISSQNVSPFWFENMGAGLIGTSYCGPAVPNSSGLPSRIIGVGSTDVAANNLTLRALDLPTNAFGFFIVSQTEQPATPVVSSSGRLCLTGAVGRYVGPGQVSGSGATGSFSLGLDLNAIPQPLGFVAAQPGSTWSFQAWHRDTGPSGATSNFTDGLRITFL